MIKKTSPSYIGTYKIGKVSMPGNPSLNLELEFVLFYTKSKGKKSGPQRYGGYVVTTYTDSKFNNRKRTHFGPFESYLECLSRMYSHAKTVYKW